MLNEEFEKDFETVGEDLIQQNLESPTSNNNSISNISGTESPGSRRSRRLYKSSNLLLLLFLPLQTNLLALIFVFQIQLK